MDKKNNLDEFIKMEILFENGTYEIHTYFEAYPQTNATLMVDTKRHQYFITCSQGELSSKRGVKVLIDKLKTDFVDKIAEYTNKESLTYRSNPNARDLQCGSTNYNDNEVMKNIITIFSECSMSYKEKSILEEKGDCLGFYPTLR